MARACVLHTPALEIVNRSVSLIVKIDSRLNYEAFLPYYRGGGEWVRKLLLIQRATFLSEYIPSRLSPRSNPTQSDGDRPA